MPTQSPKLPPIPQPQIPLVDQATGKISTVWYDYFRALDQILRVVRTEIP